MLILIGKSTVVIYAWTTHPPTTLSQLNTEHSNQCHNHSPYFPLQERSGFPQTPFQCINHDRVAPPVEMHPYGTVAYMFIEPRYRIHRHSGGGRALLPSLQRRV